MALSRRLAVQTLRARYVGLRAPRLTPMAAALSIRSFATTPRRLQAEPVRDHQHPPRNPHQAAAEFKADVNPYKGGPSAVDKAVHLLFFTEILRG